LAKRLSNFSLIFQICAQSAKPFNSANSTLLLFVSHKTAKNL